jgi:hypothetical protein
MTEDQEAAQRIAGFARHSKAAKTRDYHVRALREAETEMERAEKHFAVAMSGLRIAQRSLHQRQMALAIWDGRPRWWDQKSSSPVWNEEA